MIERAEYHAADHRNYCAEAGNEPGQEAGRDHRGGVVDCLAGAYS